MRLPTPNTVAMANAMKTRKASRTRGMESCRRGLSGASGRASSISVVVKIAISALGLGAGENGCDGDGGGSDARDVTTVIEDQLPLRDELLPRNGDGATGGGARLNLQLVSGSQPSRPGFCHIDA